MKDPVILKIYRGPRLISIKQFLSPQIVIGRQADSGLALDDESVAPLHAVLEKREDGFYLSDMGSPTGVSIEGQKVLESKVEHGEAIGVGPYSIRFYVGVPSPPVKPDYEKEHIPPVVTREQPPKTKELYAEMDLDEDIDVDETTDVIEVSSEDFKSEEVEATDPNVFVGDTVEATDPGVNIVERDLDEALESQRTEPVSGGYVAPTSEYSSVDEIINPQSRGSVLEVVLAWKERVIETHHFSDKKDIIISNSHALKPDVVVPLLGSDFKHKLVSLDDECVIHIAGSMSGEFYQDGKAVSLTEVQGSQFLTKSASGSDLKLDQGQMLKLNFMGDKISLYIRFVEDAPLATRAPVFDFNSSELVGIFMAAASIAVLALYMLFYVPDELGDTDKLLEDRLKKAVITFNPPPRVKVKIPPQKKTEPIKKPKVTKVGEKASKPKKPKSQVKAGTKNPGEKKRNPGKPKNAAPSRVKTKNTAGSSRPGGSVKTGKKAANQESKKKDLTKTGILSVLSGGGANTSLDKAYSGVGTTVGTADSKTGYQGQLSDQAGDGIGTKLQKAGKGGSGSSLAGVSDVKTSGRGGGDGSYGEVGLGGKGTSTIINVDSGGDEYSASIDADAIRRLIRRNKNALKACYDRVLSRNSSLSGKVVLGWRITEEGKMVSPKVVSSTLKNSEVESCLIRRLMGLKFPNAQPGELAEVESYPFVFEARN